MGYYIYGDAAYPLRSWLMVGFRNPQNEDQERFNMHGFKARVIIECAFGKLKGQWRCLHNGLKTRDTQLWKSIIVCCCTRLVYSFAPYAPPTTRAKGVSFETRLA